MNPLTLRFSASAIEAKTSAIYDAIQKQSVNITQPNFEVIAGLDVQLLFDLYDRDFFNGWLNATLQQQTGKPLRCRISSRMTKAGGKTGCRRTRDGDNSLTDFEIVVSSRLLFLSFEDVTRPITIGGLACHDRLEAFQRIMEHEIIHLIELLACGNSSCNQPRFQNLIRKIFGHTEVRHELITPAEHAAVRHQVVVGSEVSFEFEGRQFTGRVNRINRRATVLVESKQGERYSDGKRYAKYYVPVQMLRPISTVRQA